MKQANKFNMERYRIDDERFHIIQPSIPVCIPKAPFRIHPDHKRVFRTNLCNLNNYWYIVDSGLARSYRIPKLWRTELFEGIDEEGNSFLLPLTHSSPGYETWHDTLETAIERSRKHWISIAAIHEERAFAIIPSKIKQSPDWPEHTFKEVVMNAFHDRTINEPEDAEQLFKKRSTSLRSIDED